MNFIKRLFHKLFDKPCSDCKVVKTPRKFCAYCEELQ
jgi:hypothetical protein